MQNAFIPAKGLQVTPNIRLERPIGVGGMGSVWVAHHQTLDAPVAVKFVSADVPPSLVPMLLGRFEREARAVARIRSPHVVEVKDFGTLDGGVPFLVMELLEGESLRERIDRVGPLEPTEVATIVSQVAKALAAAHALGICHRDIKPDNVFLANAHDEVVVKVFDFGIAKTSDLADAQRGLTGTQSMLGTPDYMSPEQLLSPKDADQRVDHWSLAVVAYELLTGYLPFSGETLAALSIAISTGRFPPATTRRSGLPRSIDAWFELALNPDPTQRFTSARDLAAAFRLAAEGMMPMLNPPPSERISLPAGAPSARSSLDGARVGKPAASPLPFERSVPPPSGPESRSPSSTMLGGATGDNTAVPAFSTDGVRDGRVRDLQPSIGVTPPRKVVRRATWPLYAGAGVIVVGIAGIVAVGRLKKTASASTESSQVASALVHQVEPLPTHPSPAATSAPQSRPPTSAAVSASVGGASSAEVASSTVAAAASTAPKVVPRSAGQASPAAPSRSGPIPADCGCADGDPSCHCE
ncbi:MAG: protein kinase [Deltaproteobacteria bacterium]|nr:protein kinase [Deltaproteobacteria bacterium]